MSYSQWQALTTSAIMGTQRRGSPTHEIPGLSQEAQANLRTLPLENQLLTNAALLSALLRAGYVPPQCQVDLPEHCPPDSAPPCSPQVASYLLRMLRKEYPQLLPEWFSLALQHGLRLNEVALPMILDYFVNDSQQKQMIIPLLGKRGEWLANQNPAWATWRKPLDQSTWENGSRKERSTYLDQTRKSAPNEARLILQSTFEKELAVDRAHFLEILSINLSPADESFLELTLNDRSKEVRRKAADLLASLPNSQLVNRMRQRLKPLISLRSSFLRTSIEVKLPETCTEDMQRDGILPDPPQTKIGQKAWWFTQMMGCIPPSEWGKIWGKSPQQIIDLIRGHEWEGALRSGLITATARHKDIVWSQTFLSDGLRHNAFSEVISLIEILPQNQQDEFAFEVLRQRNTLAPDQPMAQILTLLSHTWNEPLSQAVLRRVALHLRSADIPSWRWSGFLENILPYLHPDTLIDAIQAMTIALEARKTNDNVGEKFLAGLHFRLEMRRAIINSTQSL